MQAYLDEVGATVEGHQATRLVGHGAFEMLEGATMESVVITKFPSIEAARAWYTQFPAESGYHFDFARRRPPTRRAIYPESHGVRVYDSPAYREVRRLRHLSADYRAFIVEGV
jgi:uncharacterized protein (DUF1330 family)